MHHRQPRPRAALACPAPSAPVNARTPSARSAASAIAAALPLLLALTALPSQAQDTEQRLREARLWATSCAACHGTDGQAEGAAMRLAGKTPDYLYENLLAFKSGARPATVMHHHARGYTDQELRRLAEHFGRLR